MKPTLTPLEQTFLDLAAIDEIHPHEHKVLAYIATRLEAAGIPFQKDAVGNVIARIPGGVGEPLALVGHTDIATPLNGRQVVIEPEAIKTDGTGLLGGDDKAAVAVMLELADAVKAGSVQPARPIELIFTVGEEAGCVGAAALDATLLASKQALIFDWMGRVNHIVTKSPAYLQIDVEYTGRTAHPAEWQKGKNAGAALIEAASQVQQGEYAPGVTCNIGIMKFGEARNQVCGRASLQAELRSYDTARVEAAAASIKQLFAAVATKFGAEATLAFEKTSAAYELNQAGALFSRVKQSLAEAQLQPDLESTYGCFDGNVLAPKGLEVIILGAGYHNPHGPSEYLDRAQFAELMNFITQIVAK